MRVLSVSRWLMALLLLLTACTAAPAVSLETELVSPNVFVRGVQLQNGIRYTATFIKPTDATELRDVLVEITLPVTVALTGMTVPRQTSAAEIRENGTTRTLVWRVAHVGADAALDAFAFTVTAPLADGLEFYMAWRDAANAEHIEHFIDYPQVLVASQAEADISVTQAGYVPIGESGVQVSAPVRNPPLGLHVRVLPAAFNPPAEYGALWWCSLVEVLGVPAGETVDVVVPLRRPVAPFTPLALFRQNADGSWSPAPGEGVVTADGLFVAYAHPGGVIATGGDESLQPAQVDLTSISDGASNTLAFAEAVEAPKNSEVQQTGAGNESGASPNTAPSDGTSNTIVLAENNPAPASQPNDGTSNTIIIGENPVVPAEPAAGSITDGNSNTIIVGESITTLVPQNQLVPTEQIKDGSSNTIIISESNTTPNSPLNATPLPQVGDGASNTIIISERTITPIAPLKITSTSQVKDGTSNTIIISEATVTPVAPISATPTTQVRDGTSNTIIISEITRTPGSPLKSNPTTQVGDGTSNTIIISETIIAPITPVNSAPTATATSLVRLVTATPTSQAAVQVTVTRRPPPAITLGPVIAINPKPSTATPAPLGHGSVRIVIITRLGGVTQCQAGGLACAPLRRVAKP